MFGIKQASNKHWLRIGPQSPPPQSMLLDVETRHNDASMDFLMLRALSPEIGPRFWVEVRGREGHQFLSRTIELGSSVIRVRGGSIGCAGNTGGEPNRH